MSLVLAPGWRGSPAHMFLLGSFLEPRKVKRLTTLVEWELLLGDSPAAILEQFLAEGLLESADPDQPLAQILDQFTHQELQEMLRTRGLPVSGRKDQLISRLIEADPDDMEELARQESALRCTDQGRAAVGEFLAAGLVKPPPGIEREEPYRPTEADRTDAREHLRRGLAHARQGELEQAQAEFNRAVELNPEHAPAYYWRGVVLDRLGDYPRALVDFHQAIALDPDHARSYVGRGDAYRKLGDYRMAILEYDAAIKREPALAAAYHNRGVAHECLLDYQRALGDYDKAAELSPESAEPYFGRGVAYAQAGDYERAAEQFKRAVQLAGDAEFLARAKERLGRVQMYL